jgi:plasmid stabilization system protein ParE
MANGLVIRPEAIRDIQDARDWYEERRAGLGDDFVARVEACIEAIRRTPEGFGVVHENYRRALVRRFPYSVFYEYEGGVITVYCVFHNSQDPQRWRSRLP